MIIVDGTDCTGKTTLCKKIVKRMNEMLVEADSSQLAQFRYQHLSALPPGWRYPGSYFPLILGGMCVVQDRFHASELAYGVVVRGETFLTPQAVRTIEGLLDATLSTRVLLRCSDETTLRDRHRLACERREEMFDTDVVVKAGHAFDEDCDSHSGARRGWIPKVAYDFVADVSYGFPDDAFVDKVCREAVDRLMMMLSINGFDNEALRRGDYPWTR